MIEKKKYVVSFTIEVGHDTNNKIRKYELLYYCQAAFRSVFLRIFCWVKVQKLSVKEIRNENRTSRS